MSDIRVNDGKGFYDNGGLIDTLIVDCNELPRLLVGSEYVAFCAKIVEMVQKLTNLKNGIENDLQSKDEIIADLRQALCIGTPEEAKAIREEDL